MVCLLNIYKSNKKRLQKWLRCDSIGMKKNSKEEEINSMGVKQIVLKQRTSAQIKEKQTQEKINKEGSGKVCI